MNINVSNLTPASAVELAWEKVRGLKDIVKKHQKEGDELRRLPPAVAEAFLAADLYRVMVPVDFGGLGIDPLTMFDLVEEMASYDGSTGWNFTIGGGGSVLCGSMSIEKLAYMFGDPHCNLAGSGSPPGRAVATEGGYLLTGCWGWGSAVHQARHAGGNAFIFDGDTQRMDNGAPVMRFFFIPQNEIEILDTWNTGGMRGTGSTHWQVKDHFVPEDMVVKVYAGVSEHPAPVYRLPGSYFGFNLCCVSLGAARGAIEGLKALGQKPGSLIKDNPFAQYALAKAEALHEANRLNVRESFRPIWEAVQAGEPVTLEQKARARRSYVLAVEASIEAVQLVVEAAGGAGVSEDYPFARALRDVHATHAHIVLSRKFMELAGQVSFGDTFNNPIF
jgi:alkylation response protein AidB-like acyl-CoA dehydrogenase